MDELLSRPIQLSSGLLMGLKSGSIDTAQAIEVISGSAKVVAGPVSQAHNRSLAAVAKTYAVATNSATWVAGALISYLEISALLPTGAEETEVINTATTRIPFTGQGKLSKVILNSMAATATLTIYDAATAIGTPFSIITAAAAEQAKLVAFDSFLKTGLTIVTTGVVNITVVYKQGGPIGYAVINAPNDAVASLWLAEVGNASTDVQYFPIFRDRPCEIPVELGNDKSGAITRVDIATTIDGLRYFIGAK